MTSAIYLKNADEMMDEEKSAINPEETEDKQEKTGDDQIIPCFFM